MMADEDKKSFFTQNTMIPLGMMVTIVLGAIGFHLWLMTQFTDVKNQAVTNLVEIKRSIDSIDRRVERMESTSRDRWTASDMKIWELECSRMNPQSKYPNVWEIIQQRKANDLRFPASADATP
jgi:hypothetical protein